jgi:hypothetical protein
MRFSVKKTFFTSGFPNFPLKNRKTNVILLLNCCMDGGISATFFRGLPLGLVLIPAESSR